MKKPNASFELLDGQRCKILMGLSLGRPNCVTHTSSHQGKQGLSLICLVFYGLRNLLRFLGGICMKRSVISSSYGTVWLPKRSFVCSLILVLQGYRTSQLMLPQAALNADVNTSCFYQDQVMINILVYSSKPRNDMMMALV